MKQQATALRAPSQEKLQGLLDDLEARETGRYALITPEDEGSFEDDLNALRREKERHRKSLGPQAFTVRPATPVTGDPRFNARLLSLRQEEKAREEKKPLALREAARTALPPPHAVRVVESTEEERSGSVPTYAEEVEHQFLPTLFYDVVRNGLTYALIAVLCALALFKVYQAEKTRALITAYNECYQLNQNLEDEWRSLTGYKQSLTEHQKVRQEATERLGMVPPRIDDERVITLR